MSFNKAYIKVKTYTFHDCAVIKLQNIDKCLRQNGDYATPDK